MEITSYYASHLKEAYSPKRVNTLTHNMCTNCCNIILSQLSPVKMVREFLHSLMQFARGQKDNFSESPFFIINRWGFLSLYSIVFLNLTLIVSLLHHPQMSRLMVKQDPMTESQYKTKNRGNNVIVLFARWMKMYADDMEVFKKYQPDQRRFYLSKLRTFTEFICGSMKYWGKYHYFFFGNELVVPMHAITKKVEHIQFRERIDQDDKEAIISTMNKIIGGIGDFFQIRKRTHMYFVGDFDKAALDKFNLIRRIVHETGYQINREGDIAKKAAKRQLICCWYKCHRMERDLDRAMRMCSACKMAYYCSQKCQKKAWKYDHRDICPKLPKLYNL